MKRLALALLPLFAGGCAAVATPPVQAPTPRTCTAATAKTVRALNASGTHISLSSAFFKKSTYRSPVGPSSWASGDLYFIAGKANRGTGAVLLWATDGRWIRTRGGPIYGIGANTMSASGFGVDVNAANTWDITPSINGARDAIACAKRGTAA